MKEDVTSDMCDHGTQRGGKSRRTRGPRGEYRGLSLITKARGLRELRRHSDGKPSVMPA